MTKAAVAAALDEIGLILELKGENDFKTRAYTSAARVLERLDIDLGRLVAEGELGTVRGLGPALQEKITTLVTTGRLPYLDELRASVPPGLFQMLRLPGIGPKKVRALWTNLGVDTLDALAAACTADRVASLKGFGAKTQEKILAGIAFLGASGGRVRIDRALVIGQTLLRQVEECPGVATAQLAGGLRRKEETIDRIVLLAAAADPGPVLACFTAMPQVKDVIETTATTARATVVLPLAGKDVAMAAELHVAPADQFSSALVALTGSDGHLAKLRQRASEKGLTLPAAGPDEVAVYQALGLPYIEPELREDTGEVEAAAAGQLPALVTVADIRGVFHNHTTASDGTGTLAEMAAAAQALGLEYFGVGDHSQSLTLTNGLTPDRVRQQWAEIDALNATLTGLRVLKGTECDILEDGSLDYPDDLLAGYNYVVASVHSYFNLSEAEQTRRVCRALAHPAVTWLGHATGRLLLRREGYKLDLDAVLRTAAEHGKLLEINAQPSRLDLEWKWVKRAKAMGIPLVINPDAHGTAEVALYPFGVNVARRGWLTKDDVFNTQPLAGVMRELERRKAWASR